MARGFITWTPARVRRLIALRDGGGLTNRQIAETLNREFHRLPALTRHAVTGKLHRLAHGIDSAEGTPAPGEPAQTPAARARAIFQIESHSRWRDAAVAEACAARGIRPRDFYRKADTFFRLDQRTRNAVADARREVLRSGKQRGLSHAALGGLFGLPAGTVRMYVTGDPPPAACDQRAALEAANAEFIKRLKRHFPAGAPADVNPPACPDHVAIANARRLEAAARDMMYGAHAPNLEPSRAGRVPTAREIAATRAVEAM